MIPVISVIDEVADIVGGSVYEEYSGRAMYGKTCVGITCEHCKTVECIEQAAIRGLSGAQFDSMGLDVIVYWPDFSGEDEIEEMELISTEEEELE